MNLNIMIFWKGWGELIKFACLPQGSLRQWDEPSTTVRVFLVGKILTSPGTGDQSLLHPSASQPVCSSVLPYLTHVPYLFTVAYRARRRNFCAVISGN